MDSEFTQEFVEQAADYLPKIRGGILICAQEGNAFGELTAALRHVVSLRDAAQIVGLDEISKVCEELERKLESCARLNQPISGEQSRFLLDKLIEFEVLLAKIQLGANDFPEDVAGFIEKSFGQLGLNQPIEEAEEFEIDEEMLEVFALEAEDLIRSLNENLKILGEKPNDREALLEIRRNAHTLKGSAGIVGLKKLSETAHRVEDTLDFLTENEIEPNARIFELLLTVTDCFAALASNESSEQLTKKIERVYFGFDEIRSLSEKAARNAAAAETEIQTENEPSEREESQNSIAQNRAIVRISLEKLDDMVKVVSGLVASRSVFERRLAELERQIGELRNSARRLQSSTSKLEIDFEAEMLQLQNQKSKVQTRASHFSIGNHSSSADFDTLEFDRYTEFHQTTRELLETTSDTAAIGADLDALKSGFESLFDNQRRLIEEMQNKLLRLRMVAFGSLAVRLRRTVRVICEEEDKSAELHIEGENLEIDTQILDSLIEPLLHLLRNAVAHGIESPETRRLLGKPETGKIVLRLVSEGTHIVLTISDDGRGISAAALKEKAVRNNYITKEEAERMSEAEVFELIFLPGLTTAEKVNQVSGRGIGMNVVKTSVIRQQGAISVASETHKGSTFTIRLPAALAVARALLVKANNQIFAFPLNLIKHIGEISAEQLGRKENIIRCGYTDYTISHLNELLDLPISGFQNGGVIPLLLLETLDKPRALVVDEIIKSEEIVIKPLGKPLRNLAELLGATILGDGGVVPVLDLIYLLKNQTPNFDSQVPNQPKLTKEVLAARPAKRSPRSEIIKVMIVDDSPSVRHITSKLIKSAGWTAIPAKDGLEALEILQVANELPNVILSDVEMPRMNGYELLASLKQQENLRGVPVVMITSRAGEKHRQKAFDLGVSDYLVKPFEDSDLIDKIKILAKSN